MAKIDHFFQMHHRRLRERFGVERCERHAVQIMAALEKRRSAEKLTRGQMRYDTEEEARRIEGTFT